jgi:hypothetical protein
MASAPVVPPAMLGMAGKAMGDDGAPLNAWRGLYFDQDAWSRTMRGGWSVTLCGHTPGCKEDTVRPKCADSFRIWATGWVRSRDPPRLRKAARLRWAASLSLPGRPPDHSRKPSPRSSRVDSKRRKELQGLLLEEVLVEGAEERFVCAKP